MSEVHVAVSVVWREGRILIARRPQQSHQGGLLEFPGGKVEPGECIREALSRELEEETGLQVPLDRWQPLIGIRHDYGDKQVFLDVWETLDASGEPEGREGQPLQWLAPGQLKDDEFPAANRAIIRAVRLPRYLCITRPDVTAEQLREAVLRQHPELVVLRAPGLEEGAYRLLAGQALDVCQARGANLLVHGHPELVAQLPGVAGVHLPWAEARKLEGRPVADHCWLGVSCHNEQQLAHAAQLGADYATLGPVCVTPTHPGALPMGWPQFAGLAAATNLPVFALGGVSGEHLPQAREHGAQGIAGIRFWQSKVQEPTAE